MARKKPTGRDDEYSIGSELSEEEKVTPVESAASKKKKKKKEKEKEKKKKKNAAEENQQETKTEINRKKVPKHVREIQLMLAKLKEAEEKKQGEEEERMRKEEEERRRQQELDWVDRPAVRKKLKENEEAALLKARLRRIGGMHDKYDRKSDPNGPRKDLMEYARLAIASYNTEQQESQWYNVVDIIQSGKTRCFGGYNVHMDFTAKLCYPDDDDAIIFTARLYEKFDVKDVQVRDVRRLMGDAPLCRHPQEAGTYLHHKEIKAAQGIKITAQGLQHAIAGTSPYVVGPNDDLEDMKDTTTEDIKSVTDQIFKAHIDNLKEERNKEAAEEAVFPCVLKIMPNCVFNNKNPIVLGVDVVEGIAKIGTPLCVPQKEFIEIGRIASIEINHKPVDYAKKGQKVAIKIIGSNLEERQKKFGWHFEMEDELVSKISRNSLDALKENYGEDLSVEEKRLLFKLKRLFKIP